MTPIKNRLTETVLMIMSGHILCFHRQVWKIITKLSLVLCYPSYLECTAPHAHLIRICFNIYGKSNAAYKPVFTKKLWTVPHSIEICASPNQPAQCQMISHYYQCHIMMLHCNAATSFWPWIRAPENWGTEDNSNKIIFLVYVVTPH